MRTSLGGTVALVDPRSSDEKFFAKQDGEQDLGLSPGTVSRILEALVAEGLLARDTVTEGHYLGSGAVLLGQAAQRAFGLDKALPVLDTSMRPPRSR